MSTFRARAASYTHAGRRRSNQDAVVERAFDGDRQLVAVADGMGGQSAGEVASARTLEVLVAELEVGSELGDAIRAANRAVYQDALHIPERRGMGTTLVALLRLGNTYHVANVGDSRAYRVTEEGIEQITADHSFVAEARRAGTLSADEALASPWRNALTRAVGTEPQVQVDLFGPFQADVPHLVLLCSDGLHKSLPEGDIWRYVLATEDVDAGVQTLGALAFRHGSDDNISVAAVEFGLVTRSAAAPTLPVGIARQAAARRNGDPAPRRVPEPAPPRVRGPRLLRERKRAVLPRAAIVAAAGAAALAWFLFSG